MQGAKPHDVVVSDGTGSTCTARLRRWADGSPRPRAPMLAPTLCPSCPPLRCALTGRFKLSKPGAPPVLWSRQHAVALHRRERCGIPPAGPTCACAPTGLTRRCRLWAPRAGVLCSPARPRQSGAGAGGAGGVPLCRRPLRHLSAWLPQQQPGPTGQVPQTLPLAPEPADGVQRDRPRHCWKWEPRRSRAGGRPAGVWLSLASHCQRRALRLTQPG